MASAISKERKRLLVARNIKKEGAKKTIEEMRQYKKLSQELRMYCKKQREVFAPDFFEIKKPKNYSALSEKEKNCWERKAYTSLYYRKKEKKEEIYKKIWDRSPHLSRRTKIIADKLRQDLIHKL